MYKDQVYYPPEYERKRVFCVDCRYYWSAGDNFCTHVYSTYEHVVTKKMFYETCINMRKTWCGIEGKLFTRKSK